MLQSLLYFILISIFCIIWGLPLYLYYAYKNKTIEFNIEQIIFSFFVGICSLAVVSSWVSLFFPVRFPILLLATLPILLLEILWLRKTHWRLRLCFFTPLQKKELILLILAGLLFSLLSTGTPVLEDTDLYHVQSIRWVHEFGTVPGISNLYLRYGFYSNWFHLISLFQLPFKNQNYLYLNFTFVVWAFLFLFYQYKKYSIGTDVTNKHLSLFYFLSLLFMFMEWDLFRVASSSTSYDFIVTTFTLIGIHLLVKIIFFKKLSKVESDIFILLITTAPFFKITGFLLAPFILVLLTLTNKKTQILKKTAFIGVISFLPYAYKNYLQSGYLFYPYQFADFLSPSWKVPNEMVTRFNEYIYLGNHYINQAIPKQAWDNRMYFSYYKDWFLHLVKFDQILIAGVLIFLPVGLFKLKRLYSQGFYKLVLFYSACLIPLAVWLFLSPDLRFAFGFLIFLFFFSLTAVIVEYVRPWSFAVLVAIFAITTVYYIYKKGKDSFEAENVLWVKTTDLPPYSQILINNQIYNVPKRIKNNWNSRCYGCPLPCIYHTNPYLRLLGENIRNGFRMHPYPDSAFVKNYRY